LVISVHNQAFAKNLAKTNLSKREKKGKIAKGKGNVNQCVTKDLGLTNFAHLHTCATLIFVQK
jgi:hypothetical protein